MYRSITQLTAFLMICLGATMLVVTAWRGGGVGLLLGVMFIAAGVGRMILLRRSR
jgi:hypothetical protein